MNQLLSRSSQRSIEHEGFFQGSQGCAPDEAIAEIDHNFNQKKEAVAHKVTPRLKELEAIAIDARQRRSAAQERLESIKQRHAGHLPEILVPVFMVGMGMFCMAAEANMLAPFMDLFDITSPIAQFIGGLAIACGCAVLLHLAIDSLTPGKFERNSQRMLRVAGTVCLLGLLWAGVTRGRQAAYGASVSGSPLAGSHLRRGDTMTIIPITGDAEADLQGRILYYAVPTADERQAYDADLRKISSQVASDLDGFEIGALAHPEQHTDILGTIRIAMAEFSAADTDKRLIVLSDFLQDNRQLDFRSDRRLATSDAGKRFGTELRKGAANHPPARAFFGRLRSADYAALNAKRREGIDAFWLSLIPVSTIEPDGPQGLIRQMAAD